jgi:hypothetical protein
MENNVEEDIYKDHKLIAEFMGFKYYPFNEGSGKDPGWKSHPDATSMNKHNNAHNLFAGNVSWTLPNGETHITKGNGEKWVYLCRHHKGLNYDTDWNWLMGVVNKIGEMINQADEIFHEQLQNSNLLLLNGSTSIFCSRGEMFKRVVEFIKWYNKIK